MSIDNIGHINSAPRKLEESAPAASAVPSQNPTSARVGADAVKQASESKLNQVAGAKESGLNEDELKRISEKLQGIFGADLIFSVDERSGEHVIRVLDKSTKEIIRQIPSEEAIRIKESIDRFQKGLLVNIKT